MVAVDAADAIAKVQKKIVRIVEERLFSAPRPVKANS